MQSDIDYGRKEALDLALRFAERVEGCTPDDVLDFANKFHLFLTHGGVELLKIVGENPAYVVQDIPDDGSGYDDEDDSVLPFHRRET